MAEAYRFINWLINTCSVTVHFISSNFFLVSSRTQTYLALWATIGNLGRFADTGAFDIFNIYDHFGTSFGTGAFGIFVIYSHFGRSGSTWTLK